jgi:hypothetical protein
MHPTITLRLQNWALLWQPAATKPTPNFCGIYAPEIPVYLFKITLFVYAKLHNARHGHGK